jgi:hypothetical protein
MTLIRIPVIEGPRELLCAELRAYAHGAQGRPDKVDAYLDAGQSLAGHAPSAWVGASLYLVGGDTVRHWTRIQGTKEAIVDELTRGGWDAIGHEPDEAHQEAARAIKDGACSVRVHRFEYVVEE